MRPNRYPYNTTLKASTTEIVKAWETSYSEFLVKNKEAQESAKKELDKAICRLCQLCH
ncbi:hypothetical protein [Streptococcus fryi]